MPPIVPIAVAIAEGAAAGLVTNAIEAQDADYGRLERHGLTPLFVLLESVYSDQLSGSSMASLDPPEHRQALLDISTVSASVRRRHGQGQKTEHR